MPTKQDLPHILKLLDDDSPVVREQLGTALWSLIEHLPEAAAELDASQRIIVKKLLEPLCRERLLVSFFRSLDSLEHGLSALAEYQCGPFEAKTLAQRMDDVAEAYKEAIEGEPEPLGLVKYLFETLGYQGEKSDYYNPLNSNLISVLDRGKGNPISLCCLYVLVAKRLGFEAAGCNYPGHFLARAKSGEETHYIDCFHRGLVLDQDLTLELRARLPEQHRIRVLNEDVKPATILTRVLRNLHTAHRIRRDSSDADMYHYMIKRMESAADLPSPDFKPGKLVRHRRYGYRGVVVDYDLKCLADEDWYQSNRTQPDKDQPWYWVLVDKGTQVTYAAQSSLEADTEVEEVLHPFVPRYFAEFAGGGYTRNEIYWRGF